MKLNKKILFKSIVTCIVIIFLIFNYLQIVGILNSNSNVYLSGITIFSSRNETEIEMSIYELTNKERVRVGEHPLTYNSHLSTMAKGWSEKMINEGFFEHSNFNVGENIGEVPISLIPIFIYVEDCVITLTNNQLGSCHVGGWISSPGHYANMISPDYSSIGVGVSCNLFRCKATQMFT